MKTAMRARALRENPAAGHSMPAGRQRTPVLTIEQVDRLVAHTDDRYKTAIWLLVLAGLRSSECRRDALPQLSEAAMDDAAQPTAWAAFFLSATLGTSWTEHRGCEDARTNARRRRGGDARLFLRGGRTVGGSSDGDGA